MTKRNEPSQNRIKEVFEYNNGELYWKKKSSLKSHVAIGSKVGFMAEDGYQTLRLDMGIYKAHRIIWIMFNGQIPKGYEIDHIYGDRSDNRIENLRLATPSNNQYNRSKNKSNRSGFKGVYFETKTGKPVARIQVDKKMKRIGTFNTVEEAATAYRIAAIEYHGEFARF